jgi:hypothetical protein
MKKEKFLEVAREYLVSEISLVYIEQLKGLGYHMYIDSTGNIMTVSAGTAEAKYISNLNGLLDDAFKSIDLDQLTPTEQIAFEQAEDTDLDIVLESAILKIFMDFTMQLLPQISSDSISRMNDDLNAGSTGLIMTDEQFALLPEHYQQQLKVGQEMVKAKSEILKPKMSMGAHNSQFHK